MATIVNLNIGGDGGGDGQVYTADLILTSPYTTPTDNLLVLRSRPDIEPVDGSLVAVEASDDGAFTATTRLPIEPVTGALAGTAQPDTVSALGAVAVRNTTGTLAATGAGDTASFAGEGFAGIVRRDAVLASTEGRDTASFEAAYTAKWVAVLDAAEPGDQSLISAVFNAYTGPGFLVVTERPDTAALAGRQTYSVAGALALTEAPDHAAIVGRTKEFLDAESADTVLVLEALISSDVIQSLVDRVWVTDLLEEDMGMAFTDHLRVSDEVASRLRISQVRTETLVVRDSLAATFSGDVADTVLVSEALSMVRPFNAADRVTVTDVLASGLSITDSLTDTAFTSDALFTVFEAPLGDTALVSEVLDSQFEYRDTLRDQGQVRDQFAAMLRLVSPVVDAVQVHEELSAGFVAPQADVGVVSENLTGEATTYVALTDTVQVAETLAGTLTLVGAIQDSVKVTERLGYAWVAESLDTVIVTDELAGLGASFASLTDSVLATVGLASDLTVYAPVLADTLRLTDELGSATNLQLVGVLSDTVLVGDALQESAQTVYVVNAETGAVSTYTLTPTVSGMASFQGTLYLAGPEGLYAVDADEDEDGAVIWTLQTGFSNLGTDLLKRIRDVNLQARTEGDTTLQVISDRYGQKQTWNYRLPPLTRDSYRDGVVKPGRGISSVYYALGVQGLGPAELDQLRVVVEPLSRRR